MKSIFTTAFVILFFLTPGQTQAVSPSPTSYCSSFLDNLKSRFSKGISQIEQSQPHLAYDSFGETLMRIRSESKYLSDCQKSDRDHIEKLREESARTLTALSEQIQ